MVAGKWGIVSDRNSAFVELMWGRAPSGTHPGEESKAT